MTARSVRHANKSLSRASPARPDPLQIVRLIDWGDNPERLMGGDFSGLHPEAQRILNELSGADQVRRLSDRYGLPSDIVAIALLANFASDEDRRAGRIWSAILKSLYVELANKMRRDFMKPLELFFGQIEGRLSSLVGELASSVHGDLEQAVMEVATKTRSRLLAIIRELEAEAEHRIESVIRTGVEEAEQEFLQASRMLKDRYEMT
jgi:hypothetical protein